MSYILLDVPHLLQQYGYLGVFVIIFLESGIFFALPGDSLLFTAGLLAAVVGFNIPLLIVLVALATFFGSIAGYFIGVYIERLHNYSFFRTILREEYLRRAHDFFERHGKGAIILSRFVAVVRTFVPIVAGVARMDFGKFLRYNFIGSVLWPTVMVLLGSYLGKKFPWLEDYITYIAIAVVVVSIVPLAFEWIRRRRQDS